MTFFPIVLPCFKQSGTTKYIDIILKTSPDDNIPIEYSFTLLYWATASSSSANLAQATLHESYWSFGFASQNVLLPFSSVL